MFRLQTPLPDTYARAEPGELDRRIARAKDALGKRLFILGHHYQREEVIRWADARGDSLGLSRQAAERRDAEYIVFCGVHFMAEAADVLTGSHQQVILPDLHAGCSMADMADDGAVADAWEALAGITDIAEVVPITYMNSSAALKAFVGRSGGAVCTSSNARAVVCWALGLGEGSLGNGSHGEEPPGEEPPGEEPPGEEPPGEEPPGERKPGLGGRTRPRGRQVLFFPDQHLGRNTAHQLGFTEDDCTVWDPARDAAHIDAAALKGSTFLLWKGHCSVHQRFRPAHVAEFRIAHPDGIVIVHPECAHEVVELADEVGSTDYIIKSVAAAKPGSVLAIGTEIHLVDRLARTHTDRTVVSLDPLVCPCSTMFRIDARHLAWVLDGLLEGEVRNRITVDAETATWARVALERMLEIV